MPCCICTYRAYCVYDLKCLVCVGSDNLVVYSWQPLLWGNVSQCFHRAMVACYCSRTLRLADMCPSSFLCLSLRGNVTCCSVKSLQLATTWVHTLMTDTFVGGSCMPVPVSQCHFGFMTSHVGPGSLSYGCQRHYYIHEPKGANGPGPGKVALVGIPCMRPQSDMMCYMLDRCDLGSGS